VRLFANFCEDNYLNKPLFGCIAQANGKILGKVLWYKDNRSIYIIGPYVRNLYRARGIGTILVNALLEKHKEPTKNFKFLVDSRNKLQVKALRAFYKNFPDITLNSLD